MPLPTFSIVLSALIIACLLSGIWLSLHLTALAALFKGKADVVPSPKPPRASRKSVVIAVSVFCASVLGILAAQTLAITA